MHRVARARRHLAQHRQRVHQAGQLLELAAHLGEQPRAAASLVTAAATVEVALLAAPRSAGGGAVAFAVFGQLRDRDERVGDACERRHDDDRRRSSALFACCRRTMPMRRLIASGSATEVPPNFITTLIGSSAACVASRPTRHGPREPPAAA